MSFSNIGNDSLYIYFKQENAKKIYIFFLLLFFCGICFAQNTVMENYQGGMPLPEVTHIGKKQYPRMFLGTILLKITIRKRQNICFLHWFSTC
jgi:hypothetical protein